MKSKSIDDSINEVNKAVENVMNSVDNMFRTITTTITTNTSTKKKKKTNTISAAELKLLRDKAAVLDYIAQFKMPLILSAELERWYPTPTDMSDRPTHIKPFT